MKALFILVFSAMAAITYAQTPSEKMVRKGLVLGAAVGVSYSRMNFFPDQSQHQVSASLPNFKIGAMISKRAALLLYLPGNIYPLKIEERNRDRGFEAIMPALQYWVNDRWWALAGAGLGLDSPVFYDIKNTEETKFYFGKAVAAGVGYELIQKGRFAMDVQGRIHYGTANRPEGNMNGLAFDLLIGFNLY